MKKQILILTFFIAAILAGNSNSFGQVGPAKNYDVVLDVVPGIITPHTLAGCTASELTPVQGEVYTYTVNTTNATDDVRWFVYNDGLMTAPDSLVSALGGILPSTYSGIDPADGSGDYILNLGTTNNTYNANPVADDGSGSDHSIQIAWKYFDGHLPNEVLLVAYVEDDAGCANNIAVYRIIPQPAFTIDVAVLSQAGDSINDPQSGTISDECVSPIESAVYVGADDITPNGTLTVDYGENWVYFVVNGANYIDSWLPRFQISYDGGYNALEASWAYASDADDAAATWNAIDISGAWGTVPVIAGGVSNSVGGGAVPAAGGEQIVVRVRVDYGTGNEHDDSASAIHFAVDGIAYDGVGTSATSLDNFDNTAFGDLHYTDCAVDDFDNDKLDYNILPASTSGLGRML